MMLLEYCSLSSTSMSSMKLFLGALDASCSKNRFKYGVRNIEIAQITPNRSKPFTIRSHTTEELAHGCLEAAQAVWLRRLLAVPLELERGGDVVDHRRAAR